MEREHLQNWTRVGTMNLPNTCRRLSDSETPLGVAMSIEPRHRDIIAAQFPANFQREIGRKLSGHPLDLVSIDIATPKGVSEFSRSGTLRFMERTAAVLCPFGATALIGCTDR